MSDTQELSSAILAEARDQYTVHDCNECDFRKSCELSFGSDECKSTRKSISLALGIEDGYFTELLDRIEAAMKRERAIADAMLAVKDKPLPHPDPENAPPLFAAPGSAAALREALEQAKRDHWFDMSPDLRNKIFAALSAPPEPQSNAAAMRETLKEVEDSATVIMECLRHKRGPVFNIAKYLIVVAQSALAAPPRNCDVGTAQEQIDRFHEFCHSNRYYIDEFHGDDCRPDCPIGKIVDRDNKFCDNCWAAWAQMPFAPAKGKEADNG